MTTPENGKFIDLFCNETVIGYANRSANFYRHYLLDRNSTMNITVTPIIGDPAILIKMSNDPSWPVSAVPETYDVRIDNPESAVEFFRMDPDWRYFADSLCDSAGYMLDGGNKKCTMYIAVECATSDCVYNVVI